MMMLIPDFEVGGGPVVAVGDASGLAATPPLVAPPGADGVVAPLTVIAPPAPSGPTAGVVFAVVVLIAAVALALIPRGA